MIIYPKCPECGVKIKGLHRDSKDDENLLLDLGMEFRRPFLIRRYTYFPCGHVLPENKCLEVRTRPLRHMRLVDLPY